MLDSQLSKRLVLASRSPRRREIVGALVPPVHQIDWNGEETPPRNGETPEEFVLRLSLAKARGGADRSGPATVLGADTVVVLDAKILGKPTGSTDATGMLGRLRGRTHRVMTGVTILDSESGRWVASARSTDVTFREYSDAEVAAYVASGKSFDKAGGYAVQDRLFAPAVNVEGCYLNVVGLPLCEVVTLLAELGVAATLEARWRPPDSCRECPLHQRVKGQQR